MATRYFPQINSNMIITQTPYSTAAEFENVAVVLESGMRWSFARRGNPSLTGYLPGPKRAFNVSYSNITDAEIALLYAFFVDMRGRFNSFRFFDPGGNLLSDSSALNSAAWALSGVSFSGLSSDMHGNNKAYTFSSSGGTLSTPLGDPTGYMSGLLITVSAWIYSTAVSSVTIGVSGIGSATRAIPNGAWRRVSYTVILPNDSARTFTLSWTGGAIRVFGPQCAPMKGEGSYVESPAGYGFHKNCRFDTDAFQIKSLGPNQHQLALPIVEYNA